MTYWGQANTANRMLQLTTEQLGHYNLWDLYATASILGPLREELAHNNQLKFYEEEVWPLVPAVLAMQGRGLLVDRVARRRMRADLRSELAELEEGILAQDPTGKLREPPKSKSSKATNGLNTPKRVAEFLFDTLGLPMLKATKKTGARSTDQDALDRLLKRIMGIHKYAYAIPIIMDLFHRSRINTIYERYLGFEIDADGRVRARLKMHGAETGRWAYSDPPLHQYPEECRHIFIAAPGHVFVAADYSQVEARIFSYFTKDEPTLAAFRAFDAGDKSRDIHIEMAKEIFAWDDGWNATQKKAGRNASKTFRYGVCQYGGEAETLHAKLYCPCPRCVAKAPPTLEQSREQLRRAQDRWFALHPTVPAWREALIKAVCGPTGRRFTVNPFGRKRYYSTPFPAVQRELFNADIQSTAFDLIARAQRRLHARGAPIVLQHHDSLVVECGVGEATRWRDALEEEMTRPVAEMGGMVFPVEVKWGPNWRDLESLV